MRMFFKMLRRFSRHFGGLGEANTSDGQIEAARYLPKGSEINGNMLDNRAENLEWCTYQYNTKHAWNNGLCSTEKFKHYATKIAKLNKNNEILEIYPSQRIASKLNNISYKALNNCLKGKSKTSGGYKWEYANEREVK